MENQRRNKNRGYQQLRVWQDAIELYVETYRMMKAWPYEFKRIVSQQIASTDSVNEYLQFLNIALGSLGESVSVMHAYRNAGQISGEDFDQWDERSYRLENSLLKLVERLEIKREQGDWIDHLMVRESNEVYSADDADLSFQYSNSPALHYSKELTP